MVHQSDPDLVQSFLEVEAATRGKWRTFEAAGGRRVQERWLRGKRVVRVLRYRSTRRGEPAHWVLDGYLSKGQLFSTVRGSQQA